MNAIHVINPYRSNNLWVFDDSSKNLVKEPFLAPASQLISLMCMEARIDKDFFNLLFSDKPFIADKLYTFEWVRSEYNGDWYYSRDFDMEGWLCPALLRYFDTAPRSLYVTVTH